MKTTLFVVVTLATISWASSVDPECDFRKKSGLELRWPNPENCGRFYRCSRGIKREIICPNDREYDNVSGKCVPAGKGTCIRSGVGLFAATVESTTNDICKNAESGAYLPRAFYCRDFYICNANLSYLQSCDSGSYFNATNANCEPDTTTSCWQNKCINKIDSYTFPDDLDCTKYYNCSSQEVVSESCDTGSYYDAFTKTCAVDTNNDKCWLNSCVNKPDGQLVPDNCNETYYFECSANKTIKKSCGDDIFDATTLKCVSKSTTEVVPCTAEPTTPCTTQTTTRCTAEATTPRIGETTTTLTTQNTTPSTAEATTPRIGETTTTLTAQTTTPRTTETTTPRIGETTTTCTAQTTTPCSTETTTQSCKSESDDGSLNCPGGYKTGDFVADPNNCMQFLICSEGKLYNYSCGAGNYFNSETKVCDVDTTGKCPQCTASSTRQKRSVSEKGCGCPGGYESGDFVASDDCSKFYICNNGTLVEESCKYGNLFDNCNKVCVPDTNHTCWPINSCEGEKDNTYVADPKNCNKYFKCQNQTEISLSCDTGDFYNATLGYCVPDTELICSNPCANTSGIVFLPYPLDCKKFYFCNADKSFIERCSSGFFDNKKGLCLDHALCSTNICDGQVDGSTFPIKNSTKDFTVCLNNVATNRTCPSDRVYNATRGVCLEQASPNCNQSNCPSTTPNQGFATIDNSSDNFCICKSGEAFEYTCPTNFTFDAKVGVCYSNASCDPEFCLNAPEYTVAVNRHDIHSFCMCVSNVSVIVDCPSNGIFNPLLNTDGECVADIVADPECEVMKCLNAPEYTTYEANTNEGFCVCTNNSAEFRYCPDNYLFNKTLGICLAECEVEKCANNTPGYTFADEASSSSYCYCYNSTYVSKFDCPNNTIYDAEREICLKELCNSTVCLTQTIANLPFAAIDNEAAFCLCDGNKAIFYNCTAGSIFNGQVCIPEAFLHCNASLCANASTMSPYPTPAINNTAAFCYCFAPDIVRLFDCPVGTLYDENKKICISPESTSSCTCPGGYKEGQFLPNPTDCRKYYICSNGHLQDGDCGAGNYFDDSCKLCKPDTKNDCQSGTTKCTCVGGYTEGQMIPNHNSCQLFYICSKGILQEMDCGANNRFDADKSICVPRYNTRSSRTLELANADNTNDDLDCKDQEKRSVPSNCTQYEICINGIWRRRTCADLRYYNPENKNCLEPRDDTVCMWAKVTGLPVCNNATQLSTHMSKSNNCAQYYQCRQGAWHLYQCSHKHYFSHNLNTCIIGVKANICTTTTTTALSLGMRFCQDMTIKGYEANCAMYLMCLNKRWWYQYCPLGMYFNRTHNFCMPDQNSLCADVRQLRAITATPNHKTETIITAVPNTTFELINCTKVGELRAMSNDCQAYYNCTTSGKWQVARCANKHYFDNITKSCLLDVRGECYSCSDMEQRAYPLNCTAYVRCQNQRWQRHNCAINEMYDEVLQQCVATAEENSCSHGGLRPACQHGETRPLPKLLPTNLKLSRCTHFYYCYEQQWLLAACLSTEYIYNNNNGTCVPHNTNYFADKECQHHNVLYINMNISNVSINYGSTLVDAELAYTPCAFNAPNVAVPDENDCTRYYVCAASGPLLLQCPHGSYFETEHAYCRPNNGECRIHLKGVCATANDGQLLSHAHNCSLYYECSLHNGAQLHECTQNNGIYFNALTQQCEHNVSACNSQTWNICSNVLHATNLPHEKYCNIYYACVHDVAYVASCPNGYIFNVQQAKCLIADKTNQNHTLSNCQYMGSVGEFYNQMDFNDSNCQHVANGTYLIDYTNCTRYFICYASEAVARHCALGAYFNRLTGLCEPDIEHVCPHVEKQELILEVTTTTTTPSLKITTTLAAAAASPPMEGFNCSAAHGTLAIDASNCNDFYVCLSGKWRHEHCHAQHYFNATLLQCQAFVAPTEIGKETNISSMTQCADVPRNNTQLCSLSTDSLAYPGDCRCYISCGGDMPTMNRCRNGESYDSLLGFCRQNDGTCLLENGQRVGECNGLHGELVRNAENCRAYYVCINGQKIVGMCAQDEYFSRSKNLCLPDNLNVCGATSRTESTTLSIISELCTGLNESILYPYVKDNCHSYYQCIDGVPNVQLCADNLYYDFDTKRCMKEISKCVMPNVTSQLSISTWTWTTTALPVDTPQRAPPMMQDELCVQAIPERAYANILNLCKSYYVCHSNGTISHFNCLADKLFDEQRGECFNATLVNCN